MDGRARTGLAVLAVAALAAWALGGHGAALTATPAFALEHGDEVDAAYARLLPLEDGLSIEGRIEDLPDDLARFEIRVDGNAVHASGELLHDGRFRVTGLPPGTYQVWVLDGSGRYAPRDVEAGSTGVVITPRR